jgi:RHS repeat-associated protein
MFAARQPHHKNATAPNVAGMPAGGTRKRYVLSGSEEIADLDGGRNIIRRYVPGAGIDERVAQIDTAGNIVFIHNDKQNSVIAISNVFGAVTQRRAYGTYGETNPSQMTLQPNATTIHPFGYTGRRWEPELGLYYYRARWYDPALGTFLETDPIGSLDYINLYSYVGLEPGNGVDPSGLVCVSCIGTAGRLAGGRLLAAGIASQLDSPLPGPGDVVGAGILVFGAGAIVYDVGKALLSDELSSVPSGPTITESRGRNRGGQGQGERRLTGSRQGTDNPDKKVNQARGIRVDPHTGKEIKLSPPPSPPLAEPERVPKRRPRTLE